MTEQCCECLPGLRSSFEVERCDCTCQKEGRSTYSLGRAAKVGAELPRFVGRVGKQRYAEIAIGGASSW